MTTLQKTSHFWRNPWRLLLWGTVTTLLLLPLIAMQFTTEVNWTSSDFVVAGILLGGTALLIELGCRFSANLAGRAGWALLVLTCLLLIWINLAVGIIGSEDNPANLLYLVVLASFALGAVGGALSGTGDEPGVISDCRAAARGRVSDPIRWFRCSTGN